MAGYQDRLRVGLADRYAIECELGHGAMAIIFLATDLRHERKVAVKVLRPEIATAVAAERLIREIKITASLNHPHILPLLDSGEADGLLYYVTPYVDGESLRSRLEREDRLPVEEAIRITSEVASALSYAHSLGVVHRDIKPDNVLLHHGEAVVIDFGIAVAVTAAGGDKLTATGVVVGTPAYMAPEQVSGEKEADGRSDIYSLGCVLYELLAGEPPFTGTSVHAIILRHAHDTIPLLRSVRKNVPDYVEAAVERALSKAPERRFSTATEFAECLVGVHTDQHRVAPASGARILSRIKERVSLTRAAVLTAASAVILVGFWWITQASDGTTPPPAPATQNATAQTSLSPGARLRSLLTPFEAIVGPLPQFIVEAKELSPDDAWDITDELSAMTASDSIVRIFGSRTVRDACVGELENLNTIDSLAAVRYCATSQSPETGNALSHSEWARIAKRLGASRVGLFDTASVPVRGEMRLELVLWGNEVSDSGLVQIDIQRIGPLDWDQTRWVERLKPLIIPPTANYYSSHHWFPGLAYRLHLSEREDKQRIRLVRSIGALSEGDYRTAVDSFVSALAIEPASAAAAIGLMQAAALLGDASDTTAVRAARRAWELRDSLSVRDRDFVAAFLRFGPNFPSPSTRQEYVAALDEEASSYLQEGDEAIGAGERMPALYAYLRYLTLQTGRTYVDPSVQAEIDRVIAELSRIREEQRALWLEGDWGAVLERLGCTYAYTENSTPCNPGG